MYYYETMIIRSLYFFLTFLIWLCFVSPVYAATYKVNGDIIGELSYYKVKEEDNLYAIARRFDIGIVELLSANPGVDPWQPKVGTELTIATMHILPNTPREGIVLNLSELRLFYYIDANTVMTFPIGIGREGWQTPLGVTKIVMKRKNPVWTPPQSIRQENPELPDIMPAGPDNPLGLFALNLGWNNYAIHGTNRPYGIGKRSSHGCIRLYPEDIKILFDAIKVDTKVNVIDVPYKLGWKDEELFLEVTPTQLQADIISRYEIPPKVIISGVKQVISNMAKDALIDWFQVRRTLGSHSNIPVPIGIKYHGDINNYVADRIN